MSWDQVALGLLATMLLCSTLCLVVGVGRAINRKRSGE